MPDYQIIDMGRQTPYGRMEQRFLVRDDEVWIPTTYWHEGNRRYTFGEKVPGRMVFVGLFEETVVEAPDIDGKHVFFISVKTACEINPGASPIYRKIKESILASYRKGHER